LNDEEEYCEGFKSPHLVRGMMRGYELHVTNRRLFGVKNRKAGGGWILGVGTAGAIGGKIAERMAGDDSRKTIQELEEKSDFSVSKDSISQIEVKKPGTFTRGHLLISLRSGKPIEIKIADKSAYQPTLELVRKFCPEVIKVL
jgi:hypothetical protein